MQNKSKELLSNFKFYSGNYSKYDESSGSYESWEDAVSNRVMKMHRDYYKEQIELFPELEASIAFAEQAYLDKLVLGSQRALQFGGQGIEKHHSKMYNCLTSYADRPKFFNECMYWLLSGCGVGFRVFPSDVLQLGEINKREKETKTYVISDSIEGWSDAIGILVSSFMDNGVFPQYHEHDIKFDYSVIRPEGSFISGGFKAPGHEGLKNSIEKIEHILNNCNSRLSTIEVYDMVMHMSNAVLSGGVRRSASICLFHPSDREMMEAKTGNWFIENPQRARSNNSVMLLRDHTSEAKFKHIMESVKEWGEPGFVWTDDYDIIFNPCVEIGMYPVKEVKKLTGISKTTGWQGCNLTEINGGKCDTIEKFYLACEASAILGTLQAGYTNFKYVGPESKEIFDREALLGCSITGFTNNFSILLNPEIQKRGAKIIIDTNAKIAAMLGIKQAARTTCVKPAGNSSVLLGTASGIHGEHASMYFRNVQVNKQEDIPKYIKELNPEMFENSVWSPTNEDWVISFPIKSKDNSLLKKDLYNTSQLKLVKLTQQNWVEAGTNEHLCVNKKTRHNVSNTVQVTNWEQVTDYIYNNRQYFAGISLLSSNGDKDYPQAPFTAVYNPEEILKMYGNSAMFASGLIVDGLHAFNDDLWAACACALGTGEDLGEEDTTKTLLKRDWVRRINKFANNYLSNNLMQATYLMKDVYNYHKWVKINNNLVDLDWDNLNLKPNYSDINTMGSIACSGDQCEVVF